MVINQIFQSELATKVAEFTSLAFPEASEDVVLGAAMIALGDRAGIAPVAGGVVVTPGIVQIPDEATDVRVISRGDPEWFPWETVIAVVDGKIVDVPPVSPEKMSIPAEVLAYARTASRYFGDEDDEE